MNRRGLTNSLLYQSRLMLDLSEREALPAQQEACITGYLVVLNRALLAAVCEAAEPYGVSLSADAGITSLLDQWHEQRPDAWELKTVIAGMKQPGHWMQQLHREVTSWAQGTLTSGVKKADPNRIIVVVDDNQEPTNHYRIWLLELQQWVDEMRAQSDHS